MPEEMKWIGICGSVESTQEMEAYAIRSVIRAFNQGHSIMIGDSPYGIDWKILVWLQSWPNIKPLQYTVCTAIAEAPRSVARLNEEAFNSRRRYEDYQNRDFCIVDFCDVTMCIWNGKDKLVKSVFEYAHSTNRQAYLVTFVKGKPILESSLF